MVVQAYLHGFGMNVIKDNGLFVVNGVLVTFPDMYYSDWLVVHGLPEVLPLPRITEHDESDPYDNNGNEKFPWASIGSNKPKHCP